MMSVNNSVCEQLDDAADLPDLYNRELTRQKSTHISHTNNSDIGTGSGGYREWKAKSGMNVSGAKMVSTLGRALHNQGVVSHSEGNYYDANSYSNSAPGIEYHEDHQNPRLNFSEPCYSSQQHFPRNQDPYKDDVQTLSRGVVHTNGGQYHQSNSRTNKEDHSLESHYNSRCSDPCCSNLNTKSPGSSPQNHSVQYDYRLQSQSHINHHHRSDVHQDYRSPPCQMPNHYQPVHHNQSYQPRQCHANPSSCHCCLNPNDTPHKPVSPPKKSNSNKNNDASIKKLYRILWLQNEQLGLLEKQVSKLIEMNFNKESNEKTCDKKPVEEISQYKKSETADAATMTDFPCLKCQLAEKKLTSSESEPETPKKRTVDESLTLHGVDIPVNREELSSPPVSMHIDIHEFQTSSSSETDESDTTEDESEPVGWTFYDNVVGQVNNILKTASKKKKKNKKHVYNDDLNPVENMKRLGLGLPGPDYDSHNPKRVTFEEGRRDQQINLRAQSEISMNFNALASKYLSSAGGKVQDISMCNVISSNTNMSVATMRYLERHQIANRDVMDVIDGLSKKNGHGPSKKSRSSGEKAGTSKFLDITAIRQQPKLLPKDI